MGDLSPHFSRSEFACKDGCGLDTPDPLLVSALEDLREKIGGIPITIISGCRCAKHNAKVGGVDASTHETGKAADITAPGLALPALDAAAQRVPAFALGGIGVYPKDGHLHVDVRDTGKPARW
jgi:uncharacterized protein YcbK (DUF882 family)